MKYDDDFQYEVIGPIVFLCAILTFIFFASMTTGKPTPSSKIEKKVPTQEELKKIDQEQNVMFIDGIPYLK